jgi:ubiquitin-protein ligase
MLRPAEPRRRQACASRAIASNDHCSGWDGVIFLRQGFYRHAIFRFHFEFPDKCAFTLAHTFAPCPRTIRSMTLCSYPFQAPRFRFISNVQHPCVAADGTVDIASLFQWKAFIHFTWDVLDSIKRMFMLIDSYPHINQQHSELCVRLLAPFRCWLMLTHSACADSTQTKLHSHGSHRSA